MITEQLKDLWRRVISWKKAELSQDVKFGDNAQPAAVAVKAKNKMDLILLLSLAVVLAVMVIFMQYRTDKDKGSSSKETEKAPIKLEVAANALDSEKMWRNYFEDRLVAAKTAADNKLQLIESSMSEQSVAQQSQLKAEIEKLKAQLDFVVAEQETAKRDLSSVQLKTAQAESNSISNTHSNVLPESNIVVNQMDRDEQFDRPKSSRNFIPETAYVKGVLLGGISVSTAISSSSAPVPVIIRVTDRGNLPKNFEVDLTQCQIMGSSYGDLSSERAIVRAEVLSCRDPASELIHTTKIAGLIYGDDGMNGIKGKVIQTSARQLQNAMLGGLIDGFASSAKGQDQVTINGLGVNSTNKSMGQMVQQGGLTGVANAADKIADYYIKQAEAMSPVLLVSGGVKVDIVFTKGVSLRSLDVQEKLDKLRADKSGS